MLMSTYSVVTTAVPISRIRIMSRRTSRKSADRYAHSFQPPYVRRTKTMASPSADSETDQADRQHGQNLKKREDILRALALMGAGKIHAGKDCKRRASID